MKSRITRLTTLAGLAGTLLALAAPAAHAQWRFTPYVWASDVSADVALNGATVVDAHIPFSDLLKDVDRALMLRIEAQRGRFGAMADLFYVGMSKDGTQVTLPNGAPATLDARMDLTVLDLSASYALRSAEQGFALTAGTRIIGEGTELRLVIPTAPTGSTTEEIEASDLLLNGIVGFRYRRRLTARLSMEAHGDVGAGETDLTWSGGSEMAFALGTTRRYALHAGYRTLSIAFKEHDDVQSDVRMSGLLAGFRVAF